MLQEYKNQEFLPLKLKVIANEDEEVILTLPPEPLHTNLLGPVNQVVEALEKIHKEEMEAFYKKHNLKKSGDGPGGKFYGPSLW